MSSEAARPSRFSRPMPSAGLSNEAHPASSRASTAQLSHYVFDVLLAFRRNVITEPPARRELLRCQALARLDEPIRELRSSTLACQI